MNRRVVIKLYDRTINKSATGFETRNDTTGREVYAEQGGGGYDPRRYLYRFRS